MDTKKRSLAKAVSWRLTALIVLSAVSYIFTGDLKQMTEIAVVYTLIQIFLYFIHERAWMFFKWGLVEHPLSEINVAKKLSPEDREEIEKRLKQLWYM